MRHAKPNRGFRLRITLGAAAKIALVTLCLCGVSAVMAYQSGPNPTIDPAGSSFDPVTDSLTIRGQNFQKGATVTVRNSAGEVTQLSAKVKGGAKATVVGLSPTDVSSGISATITNPSGSSSSDTALEVKVDTTRTLTAADVETIIAQAVAQASASNFKCTVAVVDKEGNALGVFRMSGAATSTLIGIRPSCTDPAVCGLENQLVPADFAAISKAGTGAFLSSQGEALTTRTASFIVQQHFPPGVDFTSSGPLFGVQFSQLPCSDVNPALPLGLSADPGGVPLYKNGQLAGGIGVEGDGHYGAVLDPTAGDQPVEELVAVAGTRGFEAPAQIQGNKIIVNGIRFPFVNTPMPPAVTVPAFSQLPGRIEVPYPIRGAQPSKFRFTTVEGIPVRVSINPNLFPVQGDSFLSASEVEQLLVQAIKQGNITRAAIRQPLGSAAQINMTVCDRNGKILGIISSPDAPIFGFDVSAQKARTAAFYSGPNAKTLLENAEHGRFQPFVDAALADGLKLDGSVAFTDRAGGFLSRPFFPDGIDDTQNGPFSRPIEIWSPFNDGLQLELVKTALFAILNGQKVTSCNADIPTLPNGIQIFPGSVPLYRNGQLVGGLGVSGDGVDQDDIISTMGSAGFEAPLNIRADQVFVRGVRLPYVKFPRHPDL